MSLSSSIDRLHPWTLLIDVIAVILVTYPICTWLVFGWRRKRDDIVLAMTPGAAASYFKAFQNKPYDDPHAAMADFKKFYKQWYGRRTFLLPTILCATVTFFLGYIEIDSLILALTDSLTDAAKPSYISIKPVAASAIAGAFVFVAANFIWKANRRALSSSDVLVGTLRLFIAVPLGYSFSAILNQETGAFVAFGLGAFPLQTVQSLFDRFTRKQLGADEEAESTRDQVTQLSCVDRIVASRLEEADITTICQLAYCDPVQTTLRTNYSFAFVQDIVSQALVWLYIKDKTGEISMLGLRGAYEIRQLLIDYQGEDGGEQERAHSIATSLAAKLEITEEECLNLLFQIGEDPYTIFLWEVWVPS
jgi:hypothetical protein